MIFTCKTCGKSFESSSKTRKFCSYNCYYKSLHTLDDIRKKNCIYCNKEFISTAISKEMVSGNKYCSSKCRRTHQSIKQKTGTYKTCLYCKQEFYVKKCNSHYKYCSVTCSNKDRTGKYNPNLSISRAKLIADGTINPKRDFYDNGWYKTADGRKEWYSSSYEKRRMKQLDIMGVKWTKNHKITIPYYDNDGNKRYYVPDFLVNDIIIEEVKPKSILDTNFNNCKIKIPYAEEYCKERGYIFRVVTEDDLKLNIIGKYDAEFSKNNLQSVTV